MLPYEWSQAGSVEALKRITEIYKRLRSGMSLQHAARGSETASSHQQIEWSHLIDQFKEQRPAAGEKTWKEHYLPVLTRAGILIDRASDGTELMHEALRPCKQGSRIRQINRRNLAAFLTWAVQRTHLKPAFLPPAHTPEILSPKRVGYPLSDAQILRLLDGIPDPRWHFAVQLCSEMGLRPEELRWLRIRDGNLWTIYRKSMGGRRGDKTEPRRLHSLPIKDLDGEQQRWNLEKRIAAGEELPPLRTDGKGAQALSTYLRRREVWQALQAEAEHSGEQLTPYSFRHRYARECHRAGLSVADIANAMGHTIEVHLGSYARFTPDATAAAFAAVN